MDEFDVMGLMFIGMGCLAVFTGSLLLDQIYKEPIAADVANEYCKSQGFDNYKSFDRLPYTVEPIAVKCGYAEKYIPIKLEV